MIDFTGVTAVTIPEGAVVRITDAAGTVLWEKPTSGDLPTGYTPREYIEFTGKQAVDTVVIPDSNTRIESVFMRKSTDTRYLYGVLSTNHTASVTAYLATTSGNWRYCGTTKTLGVSANVKHTASQDRNGVVLDGTLTSYSGVSNVTAPKSRVIGSARNTSGGLESAFFVGLIYGFKMYNGDVLAADYVPCSDPDGVFGFWDKVTSTFKSSITDTPLQGG